MKMASILPEMLPKTTYSATTKPSRPSDEFARLWKASSGFGDTWDDAGLREVTRYLLGAKGLKVPLEWEWIIPTHL